MTETILPMTAEDAVEVLLEINRRRGGTIDEAVSRHGDAIYALSKAGFLAVTAGDRQQFANGTVMIHYVSLTPRAYEFLAVHRESFR